MELRELSMLVLRLFAVILAIRTMSDLPWMYSNYLSLGNKSFPLLIGSTIIPVVIPLLFALMLWKFSGITSDKITKNIADISIPNINPEYAFSFFLALLGVYVFIYAFIDLIFHIYHIYEQVSGSPGVVQDPTSFPNLIATIVELIIGIILIIGRKGVTNLILAVRGRA